ncbi:MAG: glycoside hydrolase family 2 protein [Clostridia bacterium]|nr:glycoside hydrolase family 2 protein [Clostridia bacterium]
MKLTNWKMTYEEHKKLECTAPCSMYSVLLDHKIIDNPFYGLNEREYQHLSGKDCRFACEFDVDESTLAKEYLELTFLGLDTICEITLNGNLVDNVMNMHRAYTYDVKSLLKLGKNTLELDFSSPTKHFEKMNNKHWLWTNGDTIPGACHLRKAFYMSGWDWGPTLPDMGIFRPVVLDAYDGDKIDNVYVRQFHKNGEVTLEISVETKHNKGYDLIASIDGKEVKLVGGKGKIKIDNPKLWWVRGYGEQYLYELTVRMENNGKTLDTNTQNIGLRTLTVSTQKDATGSEFCFVINGVKIFSMGANYIPQDNLLSRINPQRTEDLIKTAIDANFNTLRVWGGGYYPEDEFYDICDKYGIMVWQDFMLACVQVWLTKASTKEYIAEAEYNVKRLRNHPSLSLLCGNNEMETGVIHWSVGTTEHIKQDYIELYERIFPEICDELCPDTFYWPASPSSGGGFDDPDCETRGDVHYWRVWHGGIPFTDYRNHKFRFCSEYGFEAFPSIKTLREVCPEDELNAFSRVVENHQKCKAGNRKILMYLADNYLYPLSFETLVYASQLLQADAIKYGVEHFRRNRGYCMGSLYWQFNDCWPVASWSSVDSNLRYKALHYAAKKFYAPVEMGLFLEGEKLSVNISNETMKDFEGEVRLYVATSDLAVKQEYIEKISVDSLVSKDVLTISVDMTDKYNTFLYADLYDKNGKFVTRNTQLLCEAKHFEFKKPEIKVDICDIDGGVEFCVSSNVFAKGVYIDFDGIDLVLSDNFFDLTDGKPYILTSKTEYGAEQLKKAVKIMTVYDIGR